jgi:hypothetical protein
VLALSTRYVPEGVNATGADLVSGGVVISSDYFKTFVAGFRAFSVGASGATKPCWSGPGARPCCA